MFSVLLFAHSALRWLVIFSLLWTICNSLIKWKTGAIFTKLDDKLRQSTAKFVDIQFLIGIVVYFKSPVATQFRALGYVAGTGITDQFFFGLIHISLMLLSVIIISSGSSVSKRQKTDRMKFKSIVLFFGTALIIILCAIPWPFSPFAQRPLLRF